MYLTAQRVKSTKGVNGINAFVHVHQDQKVPGMSWSEPNATLIAERYPGKLMGRNCPIPPGGNTVMSYLDVAAEDTMDSKRLVDALDRFEQRVQGDAFPVQDVIDHIGIRFGLQGSLYGFELDEYKELKKQILAILKHPAQVPSTTLEPLDVEVSTLEQGLQFQLAEQSERRIRAIHSDRFPIPRIRIDHDVRTDFAQIHGDIVPHLIPTLTGLNLEQIRSLGGVRFIDASTGSTLDTWP